MTAFRKYYYHHHGIKLAYKTNASRDTLVGAKDVLLFNYGLLCSNAHWKKQVSFFQPLGFKIILHDYRGHHDSSQDQSLENCNFRNMAMDTLGLLAHLEIDSCILLGHSMGVSICLEMARINPGIVSKMVLVSGIALSPQDTMFNSNIMDLSLPYIRKVMEKFPKATNLLWRNSYKNPLVRKIVLILGFNPKRVPDSFIKHYVKKIGQLDPQLFFRLLDEMRYHDIIMELETIKIPSLIIGGDKDKIIPHRLQKVFHRYLEHSQLYSVKDGGHVPQWDFPKEVNERILVFIRS